MPKPLPEKIARRALQSDFAAARLGDVIQAVDESPRPRQLWAEMLAVRALLRRDPARALERLATFGARGHAPAERAEIALLEGTAFSRLRDHRSAAARFRLAEKHDRERAFRNEIAYQRGADRWIQRLAGAEGTLRDIEHPPMALALEIAILRGAIASSAGKLHEQAAILLEARHLAVEPQACVWPHAVLASQLATLAREMPGDAVRFAAEEEVDRVVWSRDVSSHHFVALRSLGFRHALDGDEFGAFRRLRASTASAPSDPWRVMALCDRAYLARAFGERRWSAQELSDARELAQRIDWASVSGEDRHALLLLAELYAESDGALALTFVAKYRGISARYDASLSAAKDRRLTALESFSVGVVRAALGEFGEAVDLLETAWKIYDAIGYRWRACRAADQLASITGAQRWKLRAADASRAYPSSWLAHPVAGMASESQLTPAQMEVYRNLLDGQSVADIAAAQNRSVFTIRNHVKVILRAFDVSSIAALIAAARGAGNASYQGER